MFLKKVGKTWNSDEQCMYPIHWAPPLSLSSLEFTLVIHLARGRDGVVAPKILERQTKMGKSFGNHGKSMKFKLKICGNVFSLKKVPLGGAQEGILSKADFES